MNALRTLRIGSRLGLAFSLLLLTLCIVAGFGAVETAKVNDNVIDIGTNWLQGVRLLGDIRGLANETRRASMAHVLEADPDAKKKLQVTHDQDVASKLPEAMAAYERTVTSPDEKALYEAIKTSWANFVQADAKVIELSNGGDERFADARKASAATRDAFNAFMATVSVDMKYNTDGADAAMKASAGTYRDALVMDGVMVAIALLVGAALAVAITRSIVVPIRDAVKMADTVARGDLTSRVRVAGNDEPAQLLAALAKMNDNLVGIVGQVRQTSDSIATGSNQIATGNADLSQRTEEQAVEPAADRGVDGGTDVDRSQQRGHCAQGRRTGRHRELRGRARGRHGGPGGRHDGRHHRQLEEDRRHHRRDRRHRVPDQHPGAERGGRGGARRRTGPRLRGGGRRGAQPRAAQRAGGQGDQGADHGERREGRSRQPAGRRGWPSDERHRGAGQARQRPDRRRSARRRTNRRRASPRSATRSHSSTR